MEFILLLGLVVILICSHMAVYYAGKAIAFAEMAQEFAEEAKRLFRG